MQIKVNAVEKRYSTTEIDLPFDWSEVSNWYVRDNTLHVTTNDDEKHTFDLDPPHDSEVDAAEIVDEDDNPLDSK